MTVEHASDAEFQTWIVNNGLADLVDENGIAEWSFDDRVRTINFALRHGMMLELFTPEDNSNNTPINSKEELFRGDKSPSEAS